MRVGKMKRYEVILNDGKTIVVDAAYAETNAHEGWVIFFADNDLIAGGFRVSEIKGFKMTESVEDNENGDQ